MNLRGHPNSTRNGNRYEHLPYPPSHRALSRSICFQTRQMADHSTKCIRIHCIHGGPRMCIGASFALQGLKVILALVLQNYRLEFIPGARVDRLVHVTLTPKNGMPMIIRKNDRRSNRMSVMYEATSGKW